MTHMEFILNAKKVCILLAFIFLVGCKEADNHDANNPDAAREVVDAEDLSKSSVATAGSFDDLNTDYGLYKVEFSGVEGEMAFDSTKLTVIYEDNGWLRKRTLRSSDDVIFAPTEMSAVYFSVLNKPYVQAETHLGEVTLTNLDTNEKEVTELISKAIVDTKNDILVKETSCDDPNAVAADGNAYQYKGFYIGENGCFYDSSTFNINEVPALNGEAYALGKKVVWYINGANWNVRDARFQLPRLALAQDVPIVGIFNAVNQDIWDVSTLPIDENHPTTLTLVNALLDNIFDVEEIRVQGGSQGPQFIAYALAVVSDRLALEYGLGPESVKLLLNKVKVETMGGAQLIYPDGPQYVHYANLIDPVVWFYGALSMQRNKLGAGAVVAVFLKTRTQVRFEALTELQSKFLSVHGIDVYSSAVMPFDTVYEASRRSVKPVIYPLLNSFLN